MLSTSLSEDTLSPFMASRGLQATSTTLARQLLPMTRRGVDFFNVDEIQRTAFPPMSDVTAAREFLARLARAEVKASELRPGNNPRHSHIRQAHSQVEEPRLPRRPPLHRAS